MFLVRNDTGVNIIYLSDCVFIFLSLYHRSIAMLLALISSNVFYNHIHYRYCEYEFMISFYVFDDFLLA